MSEEEKAPEILQLRASFIGVYMNDTILNFCNAVDADKYSLSFTWTSTGGAFIPSPVGYSGTWIAPKNEGNFTIKVTGSDGDSTKHDELVVGVKMRTTHVTLKEGLVKKHIIRAPPEKLKFVAETFPAPTGEAPVADFTASATEIIVGEQVQFTDKSLHSPSNWLLNFGDEKTSTEQNPSHRYNDVGSFNVSLLATNALGCIKKIQ